MKYSMPLSNRHIAKRLILISMVGASIALSACSDSNSVSQASFDITVTNLSASQPLSPVAVVLHGSAWEAFDTGSAASTGLEVLAEGGDNSQFLANAAANSSVYVSESGVGIIAPGESETVTVQVNENLIGTLSLSAVSMLVNTNDAIAALNGQSIASMAVDEVATFDARSYDTGTEANTESADTIPGPAATGGLREGFNASRDDIRDEIHVHAGVVTQNDGLATSTLTEEHRWDYPSIQVRIERTL